MVRVLILFYSMYGHIYQMAKAVKMGVEEVDGVKVALKRVPELISKEVLEQSGAYEAQKAFQDIPIANVDELPNYDAIIFGIPTRFGNMAAQMRNFLDQTGGLWAKGALIGKIGSVFVGSATQHGGQESTILNSHVTLLHHGMIITGIPPTHPGLFQIDEVSGGSFYGATTIAGGKGERFPSENELAIARFQGNHVANLAKKLFGQH